MGPELGAPACASGVAPAAGSFLPTVDSFVYCGPPMSPAPPAPAPEQLAPWLGVRGSSGAPPGAVAVGPAAVLSGGLVPRQQRASLPAPRSMSPMLESREGPILASGSFLPLLPPSSPPAVRGRCLREVVQVHPPPLCAAPMPGGRNSRGGSMVISAAPAPAVVVREMSPPPMRPREPLMCSAVVPAASYVPVVMAPAGRSAADASPNKAPAMPRMCDGCAAYEVSPPQSPPMPLMWAPSAGCRLPPSNPPLHGGGVGYAFPAAVAQQLGQLSQAGSAAASAAVPAASPVPLQLWRVAQREMSGAAKGLHGTASPPASSAGTRSVVPASSVRTAMAFMAQEIGIDFPQRIYESYLYVDNILE